MLTLIDGPDQAQVKALADELIRRRKARGEGDAILHLEDTTDSLQSFITGVTTLASYRCTYLGRSWLGATVEDELLGREPRVDPHARRVLERLTLAHRGVLILVLPPERVCYHRWALAQALAGRHITLEEENRQQARFVRYQERQRFSAAVPTIVYDETRANLDELERLLEAVRPVKNAGPGIGHWRPEGILLVGEQPTAEDALGPFCDLGKIGCSRWLSEQLDGAQVSEAQFYWVNALKIDGTETDPTFAASLQPRQVIALGKVAEAWCAKARLAHAAVPHPQHWKRFHHHERYPLLELL